MTALVGAPRIEALAAVGVTQHDSLSEAVDQLRLPPGGLRIENVFRAVPELGSHQG